MYNIFIYIEFQWGSNKDKERFNIIGLSNQAEILIGDNMRDEFDIENLNPRKNPYAKMLKKPITINISTNAIDYFKDMADTTGIPYQTLINLYLVDCADKKRKLSMDWK